MECPTCKKSFKSQRALTMHTHRVHKGTITPGIITRFRRVSPGASPAEASRVNFCPTCGFDLNRSRLAGVAQFCPSCGVNLSKVASALRGGQSR
jgi:hypothetical protein